MDFKEKFARAEEKLKVEYPNAEIINPTMVELPESCTHEDYMRIDFILLDLADAIYMLKGWELSKGACMEYGYAMAKDLIILKEE
jgi:nucleoside 2-deoxyribosyltransferase